jgi:hypothetical protein
VFQESTTSGSNNKNLCREQKYLQDKTKYVADGGEVLIDLAVGESSLVY